MRLLFVVLLAGMAVGIEAYGGYGSKSASFKTRADFEPKDQTISPTLPPAESPYETPPPIPMPDQTFVVAAVEKSSSSESNEKGCAPGEAIHTTTTEHPRIGCGPSSVVEHVHVDAESGAPLEKVLPPQVGYGEPEKPAEQQIKPAIAIAEYAETAAPAFQPPPPQISASHFSSATKEEVELYGIETPVQSTPAPIPVTTQSTPAPPVSVTSPQQEVTPTTKIAETSSVATSAIPPTASGYEQPAAPSQLPVEASTQTGYEPSIAPSTNAPNEPHSASFTGEGDIDKSIETSPIPSSSPSTSTAGTTQAPEQVAVEANNGYESGPVEVPPAAASPSPPPANAYEPEETPAQEIARVPDNENLYEKIAEVPNSPAPLPESPSTTQQTSTVATTAATIPYEAPVSSAPSESPAPRAQVPTSTASSGYDLVNEVQPETEKPAEESYGQKVEAAHITEETAASSNDYDENGGYGQESKSSSSPSTSQQSTGQSSKSSNGYDNSNTNSKQSNVAPSAIPYSPAQTGGNSYGGSQNGYGQSGAGAYSQGGGGSYNQAGNLGGYSTGQQQSFLPPAPTYVQPQSFIPQPFIPQQSSSYSGQSSSNGCCGGNWFSSQGSLCAPVNYNACQSQSSGCGQSCGGCGQQSFGGFGSSSSCGGGCSQQACQPCTPVCTPPCPPVQSSCCCPQPAANPFASLCGGRKKRSIQTLLGLCGRRRRL